jgi:integrase/recombinase XerD
MPSKPHPIYRPERDQWYVRHEGRRIILNVRGADNQQAAEDAYRALMKPEPVARPHPPTKVTEGQGSPPAIGWGDLLDKYHKAKSRTLSPISVVSYRWRLDGLAQAIDRETPVTDLTPNDLEAALDRPNWSRSYQGDLVNQARMVTRWAYVNRMIPTDPLAGAKRPAGVGRRADVKLTDADLTKLLDKSPPDLRALITFLHATGARPSEARSISATDLDLSRWVIVLTRHKTAGRTGETRVIIVPEGPAREVLGAACAARPSGPIFLRPSGLPWTRTTLCHAFKKARDAAGLPKSVTPYTTRHWFCTDALTKGIPDATVAALVGHKSTTMLHRHYSGLLSRVSVLAEAAGKVRGAG